MLQLEFEHDVHVSFTILDVAPTQGDVPTIDKQTSLDDVKKLMTTAVVSNKLEIPLIYGSSNPLVCKRILSL